MPPIVHLASFPRLASTMLIMGMMTTPVSATPPDASPPEHPAEVSTDAATNDLDSTAGTDDEDAPKTIAAHVAEAGMETRDGFIRLHLDHDAGTVLIELPAAPSDAAATVAARVASGGTRPLDAGTRLEAIHVAAIRTGLGSNPVGLDRGKLGPTRLVRFREVGGRILLEHVNLDFRATSPDAAEGEAVAESFASSVIWAGEIVVRDPDGRVLVDISDFLRGDATGISRTLDQGGHGRFNLDSGRSVVDTRATLAFPDNVELESILTFSGNDPGREVWATAADATSPSFVVHHSFVRLPDAGYRPRAFDPRMANFSVQWQDYGAPLGEPIRRGLIMRHRLEKANPRMDPSPPVEPIVYYVDRAAPEPIRSALVDGARWWAEAFEAAGFRDAYRVEILPENVHPLDVRYNVIQWVHRATRGWSYGASVVDPRTGEIIKGHVSLGSLRVRQDIMLFEGLAGVDGTGTGRADDPVELALARIRQLSAHEVGHTLGFAHNFAASTQDRASVMDYPAPLIRVRGGRLDFSQAYGVGIGAWDIHATDWAYREFPRGADEAAALERIVQDGITRGLRFLSDADARGNAAAHPDASLWDNGADPIAELESALEVRRIAIDRFGPGNIAAGRPVAHLQEVFVPVYLHHRYQVEAVAKLVGGLDYAHLVRGDRRPASRPVGGDRQRAAVAALLATLSPEVLDVPDVVRALLQPRPFGEGRNREMFPSRTGPTFDPLASAAAAADHTLAALLHPARAARLADPVADGPGLAEVLGLTLEAVLPDDPAALPAGSRHAALRRTVVRALTERLIALSESSAAAPDVRATADAALGSIEAWYADAAIDAPEDARIMAADIVAVVRRHLARPDTPAAPMREGQPAPPGSPIGTNWDAWSQLGAVHAWAAPSLCACGSYHGP